MYTKQNQEHGLTPQKLVSLISHGVWDMSKDQLELVRRMVEAEIQHRENTKARKEAGYIR